MLDAWVMSLYKRALVEYLQASFNLTTADYIMFSRSFLFSFHRLPTRTGGHISQLRYPFLVSGMLLDTMIVKALWSVKVHIMRWWVLIVTWSIFGCLKRIIFNMGLHVYILPNNSYFLFLTSSSLKHTSFHKIMLCFYVITSWQFGWK